MKSNIEKIKKLIKEKKSFSMIQYFEGLKTQKEKVRNYELLYLSKSKDRIVYTLLNRDEIEFIKNHSEVKNIISTIDGAVWEYNFFKDDVKSAGL